MTGLRRFGIAERGLQVFGATVLAAWTAVPVAAQKEPCSLDPGAAATLLLPYFEVDLENPHGTTTLFSIVNTEAAAVLTRVTLWTDLGIPSLAFSVYLTGYDVETVNLRNVFGGVLPRTASPAQDPADAVSPHGDFSQDTAFPNCAGFLPPANLTAQQVTDLRAEHRGLASARLGNLCSGARHGGSLARGYVTIDTVRQCSAATPVDPAYFTPGGDATSQNVLWGDFFYVDPTGNFAQGEALVRIQAFPGRFTAGQRTFYGSLHGSPADGREPLAFSWNSRFLNGGAFDGGTDLIVWQDPMGVRVPFSCNLLPPFITADRIVFFDEQENPELIDGSCPLDCPFAFSPIPWVATRAAVNESSLWTSFDFGHLFVGLAQDPPRASWVGTVMSAEGRYGVGFASNPLDSACGSPACLLGACE